MQRLPAAAHFSACVNLLALRSHHGVRWRPPRPCLRSTGWVEGPGERRGPDSLWLEKGRVGQLSEAPWQPARAGVPGCPPQAAWPQGISGDALPGFGFLPLRVVACWEAKSLASECLRTGCVLRAGGSQQTPVSALQELTVEQRRRSDRCRV